MKKIYNTPDVKIAILDCETSIAAGSMGDVKGEYDGSLTLKSRKRSRSKADDYDFEDDFEEDFEE